MEIDKNIQAFTILGEKLRLFAEDKLGGREGETLKEKIILSKHKNGWFTEENVMNALSVWADLLSEKKLAAWLSHYPLPTTQYPKNVGIIMAGNIPLVGFHDLLCVLISGHKAVVKLSSEDNVLIPALVEMLEPSLKERVVFKEGTIGDIDAVIATGSDNTSRYFEYYFGKYPHIIRKNRTSVAVLDGNETEDQLKGLAHDIFTYFGLGCRNVSKVFIPPGYDLDKIFGAVFPFRGVLDNKKYGNNYEYNKTVFLMKRSELLENGFMLLKEDASLFSPVAMLYYEYYESVDTLKEKLGAIKDNIQCVVTAKKGFSGAVGFGEAQCPGLSDYADGVDTMKFLTGLN